MNSTGGLKEATFCINHCSVAKTILQNLGGTGNGFLTVLPPEQQKTATKIHKKIGLVDLLEKMNHKFPSFHIALTRVVASTFFSFLVWVATTSFPWRLE